MKIIKNAMIVVPEGHNGLIRNGFIRIDGNLIAEIDTMDKLTAEKLDGAEVIDAKGKIAIPGFVSTHSHLYSAVVRSLPTPDMTMWTFPLCPGWTASGSKCWKIR